MHDSLVPETVREVHEVREADRFLERQNEGGRHVLLVLDEELNFSRF